MRHEDRKPIIKTIRSGSNPHNQRVVEITYENNEKVIKVIKHGNGIPTKEETNA